MSSPNSPISSPFAEQPERDSLGNSRTPTPPFHFRSIAQYEEDSFSLSPEPDEQDPLVVTHDEELQNTQEYRILPLPSSDKSVYARIGIGFLGVLLLAIIAYLTYNKTLN